MSRITRRGYDDSHSYRELFEELQRHFPWWMKTQALLRGVDNYGRPIIPEIFIVETSVALPYNHQQAPHQEMRYLKVSLHDQIRTSLFHFLTDFLGQNVLIRSDGERIHGQLGLLIMSVDQFRKAVDMENEARTLELTALRHRVKELESRLHPP